MDADGPCQRFTRGGISGYLDAGIEELEGVIERSGQYSSHSYHVLGSQGIAWVHRCGWITDKKRALLSRLVEVVEQGLEHHPTSQDLFRLRDDLKKEVLLTVVNANSAQTALFKQDSGTEQ